MQINPEGWPRPSGFSNGVVATGRFLAISGQIGWDEQLQLVSDDFLDQACQALSNVMDILAAAGGKPEHLVRLTWYITDKNEYRACLRELGACYKKIVGEHYPAMALVQVAALLEEGAKIEIEATAVLPE
ncbi:MAG TPA: RidA family protein [Candidatus Baltobacteraceae bacterium]